MTRLFNSLFRPKPVPPPADTAAAVAALQRITAPTRSAPPSAYPATFRPTNVPGRMAQPEVFDPAVQHFRRGFRAGEPRFDDAALAAPWRSARRAAMEHVLSLIVAAPWADQLILRGSVCLRAWLGSAAREPNDLDFVAELPADVPIAESVLTDLAKRIVASPTPAGDAAVRLDGHDVSTDEIWTYDRAPGRRIVIPWSAVDLPGGTVQVDVVSGQALPVPPAITALPLLDGSTLAVRTATAELSLAWKLQWLATDMNPQGKDLYDAVLLAEHLAAAGVPLAWDLLYAVVAEADPRAAERLSVESICQIADHDFAHFRAEYPSSDVTLSGLTARLAAALAPTFVRPAG